MLKVAKTGLLIAGLLLSAPAAFATGQDEAYVCTPSGVAADAVAAFTNAVLGSTGKKTLCAAIKTAEGGKSSAGVALACNGARFSLFTMTAYPEEGTLANTEITFFLESSKGASKRVTVQAATYATAGANGTSTISINPADLVASGQVAVESIVINVAPSTSGQQEILMGQFRYDTKGTFNPVMTTLEGCPESGVN